MSLFRSTNDALRYAYSFSSQQYSMSAVGGMMARVDGLLGSGKGLIGITGAGQSGMCLAEIERLAPLHRALLTARFAPREAPCSLCGAGGRARAWVVAITQIADHVVYVVSGLPHMHLRRAIVADHFGEPVHLPNEAARYGVPERTARDQRQKIRDALKSEERVAFQLIDSKFREIVLVGEDDDE